MLDDGRKVYALWMLIDMNDKYKRPIYVCDSARELAEYCGYKNAKTVMSMASHARKSGYACKVERVILTREEWIECHS